MSDIIAQDIFSDVYLIETGDVVIGDMSGICNIPHKQLADRTVFLKEAVANHGSDEGDVHAAAGYMVVSFESDYIKHIDNSGDPHAAALLAKQLPLTEHIEDVDDPHVAAEYYKAVDLSLHVADINDPHEDARYLKALDFTLHVDSNEDPHAAAMYLQPSDLPAVASMYHATFDTDALSMTEQNGFASVGFTFATAPSLITGGAGGDVLDVSFEFSVPPSFGFTAVPLGYGCCASGGDNPDTIVPVVVIEKSASVVTVRQYRGDVLGGSWSATVGIIVAFENYA